MRKYKYDEKVVCLYCDNVMVYKNLKNHTDNKHDMQPIRYKSASSQNISEYIVNKTFSNLIYAL